MQNFDEFRRIPTWHVTFLICLTALCVTSASATDDKQPSADLTVLQEHFKLIHDIYAAVGAEKNWDFPREKGKRFRRSLDIHPVSLALRVIGQSHASAASVNENAASIDNTGHSSAQGSVGEDEHGGTTSPTQTLSWTEKSTTDPNHTEDSITTSDLIIVDSTTPEGEPTTLSETIVENDTDNQTSTLSSESSTMINATTMLPNSSLTTSTQGTAINSSLTTTLQTTTSKSPITNQSAVTTNSPSTNQSVATTTLPVTNQSAVTTSSPTTNQSVVTTNSPATNQSVATTMAPVTNQSVVTTNSPVSNQSTVTTNSPATNKTVITTKSPVSNQTTVTTSSSATNQSAVTTVTSFTNQSAVTTVTPITIMNSVTNQPVVTTVTSVTNQSVVTTESPRTNQSTFTTMSPVPSQSVVTTNPLATTNFAVTTQSVVTTNPPATEQSVVTTNPPATEQSVVTTNSPATEQSVVTTNPPATEQSVVTTNPPATEQSMVTTNPPATEQSVVTTNSPATEQSVVTTNPPATEQSVVTTNPPATEQSVVTTNPPATEQSVVTTNSPATEQSVVTTNPLTTSTVTNQSIVTTISLATNTSPVSTLPSNLTQSPGTTVQTTTFLPTTPRTYSPPTAKITGSRTIGQCGDLDMNGFGSRDNSGQPLRYIWSASGEGNWTQLEEELQLLNDENEGYGNPRIFLPGSVLVDENIDYQVNLTVVNFVNLTGWATFEVRRLSDPIFDVFVSTNVDEEAVKRSTSVILTAKVSLHTDCMTPTFIVYSWVCDDPSVQENLRNQYNRVAFVPAYSFPFASTTTCTVTVSELLDSTRSNNASIELTTATSELVAEIKGSEEFEIGIESGLVQLNGDQSYDPDLTDEEMDYEWSCVQLTDNSECSSRITNETFPESSATTSSVLEFDASHLFPQTTYRFTLNVSKDTRTAQDYVDIFATGEVIPTVSIEVIGNNGGYISASNTINIRSEISHTLPLSSVEWSTVQEAYYRTIDFDEQTMWSPVLTVTAGVEETISQVFLRPDVLRTGSKYKFQLTATTETGSSTSALVEIRTYSGVLGCQLSVQDYTILDQVEYTISDCYTDDDGYPLSYTLAVESGADSSILRYVSQKSSDATSTFVGGATWDGSGNAVYVAQICDQLGSCLVVSDDVLVTEAVQFTVEEVQQHVDIHVINAIYLKEYLKALINYATILDAYFTQSSSRKRRAVEDELTPEETNDDLMEYIRLATNGEVLDDDNTPLILEQIQFVDLDLLNSTQRDTLQDVLNTLVEVFLSDGAATVSTANIDLLIHTIEDLMRITNYTDSNLRNLINDIYIVMAKTAITGGDPVEYSADEAIYTVQNNLPCSTFEMTSQSGDFVDFGDNVCDSYGASWTSNSSTHYGVSVLTTLYQNSTTLDSIGVGYINNTASSFFDISLANPDTGDDITIQNLTDPITITLNIPIQEELSYICKYWDEDLSAWSTDGVDTYENRTRDLVECQSTHLTTFVVVTEDRVLTTVITTSAASILTTLLTSSNNMIATTEAAAPASVDGGSSDNKVVKIVVPIVVGAVILIFIVVLVVVLHSKKNSKVHMQRLQGSVADEEGGSRRSGSPWNIGNFSPTPDEDDEILVTSSRSSSPLRPPHSPEPKEFLPPNDNDEINATPPTLTSKESSSDGRISAGSNRVSPAPSNRNITEATSHTTYNPNLNKTFMTSDGKSNVGDKDHKGPLGRLPPMRPPHSPEPTEFLPPIDDDGSRRITVLTPVETDC